MTRLTSLLENGSHVFAESDRAARLFRDIASPFHGDLDLSVGPTTVIPEISGRLTRPIVHYHVEDIFARFAKTRRSDRMSIDDVCFFGLKHHGAWPAVFGPRECHTDSLTRALGQAVVHGGYGQRHSPRTWNRLFRGFYTHLRRRIRIDFLAISASSRPQAVNHPDWLQRSCNLCRLSVDSESPYKRLAAKILGHDDLEHILVTPDAEMCRLTTIASRLKMIIRPHLNIGFFLIVSIHVPEPHVVRPVRIDVVAFIHGGDALPHQMANRLTTGRLELNEEGQNTTNNKPMLPSCHFLNLAQWSDCSVARAYRTNRR